MRSSPQALRESSSLAGVILCHCSAVQAGESVISTTCCIHQ